MSVSRRAEAFGADLLRLMPEVDEQPRDGLHEAGRPADEAAGWNIGWRGGVVEVIASDPARRPGRTGRSLTRVEDPHVDPVGGITGVGKLVGEVDVLRCPHGVDQPEGGS